jgi:hypothetical protein
LRTALQPRSEHDLSSAFRVNSHAYPDTYAHTNVGRVLVLNDPRALYWKPVSLTVMQGLALVHFSAQLEPCMTQENTLHTLNTP